MMRVDVKALAVIAAVVAINPLYLAYVGLFATAYVITGRIEEARCTIFRSSGDFVAARRTLELVIRSQSGLRQTYVFRAPEHCPHFFSNSIVDHAKAKVAYPSSAPISLHVRAFVDPDQCDPSRLGQAMYYDRGLCTFGPASYWRRTGHVTSVIVGGERRF